MNYRFRTGDKGELVLQVPKPERHSPYFSHSSVEQEWRDATVADLPIMQWLGRESADRLTEQLISGEPTMLKCGPQL